MSTEHEKRIAIWEEVREWAQGRWDAEVKHRPIINVNHRALDCAWRQVMRKCDAEIAALRGESGQAQPPRIIACIEGLEMPYEARSP